MSNLLLDIERLELIRVLCRRGVQVHMRETLRTMHKDPFVPAGAWEDLRRAYDVMFPFPRAE